MKIHICIMTIIFVTNFLLTCDLLGSINPDELSLQEIIDGVNFAGKEISSGELKIELFISPQAISEVERKALLPIKKSFESSYQATIDPMKKAALKRVIEYYNDLYSGHRFPYLYECYVIFKRNQDDTNYNGNAPHFYSYRISKINFLSKHHDSKLGNLSRLTEKLMELNYIETRIVNPEKDFVFSLDEILTNIVVKNLGIESSWNILFSAGRLPILPIDAKDVTKFRFINENGIALYFLEYNLRNPIRKIGNSDLIGSVMKIWINPRSGFSIVKAQSLARNASASVDIEYSDFRKFPNGIWFPLYIKVNIDAGTKESLVEYTYRVHEAEFNVPIPFSFFNVREKDFKKFGIETK